MCFRTTLAFLLSAKALSLLWRERDFMNGEDLNTTLMRYITLYNTQFPQSSLKSKTPLQAMLAWYDSHPQCFTRKPLMNQNNQTGRDS